MALWDPSQLGTALALWLDPSDSVTIVLDANGKLQQWSDKSGINNHATQTDPNSRPGYSATGFPGGGKPAVLANQGLWLNLTSPIGYTGSAGQSAMSVTGNVEINATQTLYSNYQASGAPDIRINNDSFIELNRSYQANLVTSSSNYNSGATARHIIGHDAASGLSAVYANGTGTQNGNDPRFEAPIATLLREQNDGEYFLSPVGEIVITSRKLTYDERTRLEGYLAWKWDGNSSGLLVSQLPADHPYKTAAPTVAAAGGGPAAPVRRRGLIIIAS